MIKNLSKSITFLMGTIAMFLCGVVFIMMSDLTFNNTSTSLIVSVLLSFGSAIAFFMANNFQEKPKVMYILKGLALALAIGLIVYFHVFQKGDYYIQAVEKLRKAGKAKAGKYEAAKATMVVSLVIAYLSAAVQAANIALVAVFNDKKGDEKLQKQHQQAAAQAQVAQDEQPAPAEAPASEPTPEAQVAQPEATAAKPARKSKK